MTVRLPPDLVKRIEAHAQRSEQSRSEAIRELLEVGLKNWRR